MPTNSDDDRDPEDVLQQSKQNTQLTSEPGATSHDEAPERLADAIEQIYHDLEAGELSENLTVRDADLAALFHAYERTDRLADVTVDTVEALGRDAEEVNLEARTTALRFLLRYALQDLRSDDLDEATEGRQAYLMTQASEF